MNIQTLSIVVPTKGCINKCKFCVSRMHDNEYNINFDKAAIKKRIKWAVMNGISTCIITGIGEPLQNKNFLIELANLFEEMDHPFPNIELQTTGTMLIKYSENATLDKESNLIFLRKLGVNTISLSISNLFDDEENMKFIGVPSNFKFKLEDLCNKIKFHGFNIRLSLNMLNIYHNISLRQIFIRAKELKANQITFRKLYHSNDNSVQTEWVKANSCEKEIFNFYIDVIKNEGIPLYKLPFGATVYSISELSIVIDDNCMNENNLDSLKYVILREDGKLYSQWDNRGSLIF